MPLYHLVLDAVTVNNNTWTGDITQGAENLSIMEEVLGQFEPQHSKR
jgi:hypothetical protein